MARRRGLAGRKRLEDLTSGPGRLSQALDIRPEQNGVSLMEGRLRIVAGENGRRPVTVTRRVGISSGREWPLRFYWTESPFVSVKAGKRTR